MRNTTTKVYMFGALSYPKLHNTMSKVTTY
jgi:hypothetical protein